MFRLIAYHLPQFHRIPENDLWWGEGFTEWRNVAAARSLYLGHRQPNLPGELGFYDMSSPRVLIEQAELAKWAGLAGFCFYHYWFEGRRLLERPVEEMRASGFPDFGYCLCWANHSWTGHWAGRSDDIRMAQNYPGLNDDRRHYEYLRKFFEDKRYLRIAGCPIFVVFRPEDLPDAGAFVGRLKDWAIRDGFGGVTLIAATAKREYLDFGFDSIAPHSLNDALTTYLTISRKIWQIVQHRILGFPRWVIPYKKLLPHFSNWRCDGKTLIPTLVPNWDNTPRLKRRGLVLSNSCPSAFAEHVRHSLKGIPANEPDETVVFVKSWNEWAEGNYLEPDVRWGRAFLEVVRRAGEERRTGEMV